MSGQYTHNQIDLADELTQSTRTITTSATELFTGGSRNAARQHMRVYNDGNVTVYLGPSGVTAAGSTKGEPLFKGQFIEYTIGDVAVYAITASGSCALIVTEWS